jgi:hypothetical protein
MSEVYLIGISKDPHTSGLGLIEPAVAEIRRFKECARAIYCNDDMETTDYEFSLNIYERLSIP